MEFISHTLVIAATIYIISYLLPGIMRVESFLIAIVAALVLALVNKIIRPIVLIFTLPINLVTLGLFTFIINALMLWLVAVLLPGFEISGFLAALIGSILISLLSAVLSSLLKDND